VPLHGDHLAVRAAALVPGHDDELPSFFGLRHGALIPSNS
jgi:hypothetical protein